MKIAQMISPTLVVDHYVMCITLCFLLSAWSVIVIIKELKGHLHVKNINHNGENMQKIAIAKTKLEFVGCCKDPVKICHGNPHTEHQMHSDMMIQMQTPLHLQTTFVQQDSIVLKLFVPLVVLLLPGQSLQNQNHQQTF
jgi:hypothetical protein